VPTTPGVVTVVNVTIGKDLTIVALESQKNIGSVLVDKIIRDLHEVQKDSHILKSLPRPTGPDDNQMPVTTNFL